MRTITRCKGRTSLRMFFFVFLAIGLCLAMTAQSEALTAMSANPTIDTSPATPLPVPSTWPATFSITNLSDLNSGPIVNMQFALISSWCDANPVSALCPAANIDANTIFGFPATATGTAGSACDGVTFAIVPGGACSGNANQPCVTGTTDPCPGLGFGTCTSQTGTFGFVPPGTCVSSLCSGGSRNGLACSSDVDCAVVPIPTVNGGPFTSCIVGFNVDVLNPPAMDADPALVGPQIYELGYTQGKAESVCVIPGSPATITSTPCTPGTAGNTFCQTSTGNATAVCDGSTLNASGTGQGENTIPAPATVLTKTPSVTSGCAPLPVTYTYTEANTGLDPISNVTLIDDTCSPVNYVSGDTNTNGVLDPGETWTFTCSTTLNATTTNTVQALGIDVVTNEAAPTETATATVTVNPVPNVAATKTCDVNPVACGATSATFTINVTVSNTGGAAWTGTVSDANCVGSPLPISGTGDTTVPVTCTVNGGYPAITNSGGTVSVATISCPSGPGTVPSATCNMTCTPCLSISKSCTGNDTCSTDIPVSVTLTNCDTAGATTAESLTLNTLTDDPAVTFSCSPTAIGGTLAPGASTTCTGSYTASATGAESDTATATATGAVSSTPLTQTATAACNVNCGALTVAKSCSVSTDCTDTTISVSVVITNTGNVQVDGIAATDDKAGTLTCPSTSLAAGANMTCTGSYSGTAGQASTDTVTVTSTTAGAAITYNPQTATCTPPTCQVTACRMTGGHVETCQTYGCSDDPTTVCSPITSPDICVGLGLGTCTVPLTSGICTYPDVTAGTTKVTPVQVRKGNKNVTQSTTVVYTTGGQIGAPDSTGTDNTPLCCDTPPGPGRDPNCPSGSWEHNQQSGIVQWTDTSGLESFSGSFDFHSGTASAPVEAFIKSILCADEGWCVQARCAPDKQIFWEGTGVFHSIGAATQFPNCNTVKVYSKGVKDNSYSVHYYRAHVGDFGEPGSNNSQVPANSCTWQDTSGVSISDCSLADGFTPIDQTSDPKFGDIGGGDCSPCPDWYEIEIHCTTDPSSPIIYKVGNFITNGNFQIHPPVGSSCFDFFPKP